MIRPPSGDRQLDAVPEDAETQHGRTRIAAGLGKRVGCPLKSSRRARLPSTVAPTEAQQGVRLDSPVLIETKEQHMFATISPL
jgi:hypothetical protein